jgi:prepilin-type N-terminal cleavage/methylation domain-containing protein
MTMTRTRTERGFTLIELMTAISIFAVVMTVAMGAVLGIFNSNRKTRALKELVGNLNLVEEEMSKEIRYGQVYHCGSGNIAQPQDCAYDTTFSFLSSDNVQVTYRQNGTTIEKQVGTDTFIPLISPSVTVDSVYFYLSGSQPGDGLQPKLIIKITAHAGTGASASSMTLQTVVSQRHIDS